MKNLPIVATLITFIAIVILLKLGFWQLQRGEEKQRIAEQVAEQGEMIYDRLSVALNEDGAVNYRKVRITGNPMSDRLIYWDNRIVEGKVGYEVIVPTQTNAGVILFNIGWVEDQSFRQKLPVVEVPTKELTTTATLYQVKLNRMINNDNVNSDWPLLVAQPDITFLSERLGLELLPYIAFITESENYGTRNNFKPVTMSPEKHFGYSIQWFGLAIACFLVYVFALKKKWRHDGKSDNK